MSYKQRVSTVLAIGVVAISSTAIAGCSAQDVLSKLPGGTGSSAAASAQTALQKALNVAQKAADKAIAKAQQQLDAAQARVDAAPDGPNKDHAEAALAAAQTELTKVKTQEQALLTRLQQDLAGFGG